VIWWIEHEKVALEAKSGRFRQDLQPVAKMGLY